MLLVADIGNTETVLGARGSGGAIERRWRLQSDPEQTPDEVGVLLRQLVDVLPGGAASLGAFCAASVVPPFTRVLAEAAERHLGLVLREFRWTPELGVRLDVLEPDRVGADRVANALGAHLAYPGPAIVVDFGTATSLDVIAADGAFLGGVIAPGIETAAKGLAARTALLPRVAVGFPDAAFGRSTVESMQIGLYQGAALMVDGLVRRILAEWDADARVIATGGLGDAIASRCASVDLMDADLTLKGIAWGHDRLFPATA
ncbi:MAG TPA: type III pantothenate kinase [Gemmatimonadota bacterium]|nr:type III pantothenate kinase [Gemmatimonadota bacterium]